MQYYIGTLPVCLLQVNDLDISFVLFYGFYLADRFQRNN